MPLRNLTTATGHTLGPEAPATLMTGTRQEPVGSSVLMPQS